MAASDSVKIDCLRAGVLLYLSAAAFGPGSTLDRYVNTRNGKRDLWNAVRGLCMTDEALVRNLRQARMERE